MYFVRTPQFIQNLFPNFTWKMNTQEKQLFLTFDDGPTPEVTPWVLEQLEQYNAKATFFCLGNQIEQNPTLLQRVIDAGHSIGNHSFNHVNGWTTENRPYFLNVKKGAKLTDTDLFRPPYGRLKPKQAQFLLRHYRIVMWDVMSGDFDANISKEQCLTNVLNNVVNGSIVVFHDSLKAQEKLEYVLPKVLEHFSAKGYSFNKIDAYQEQTVLTA